MLRFIQEIRIIHIVCKWVLLHNISENVGLLSSYLQIQWVIQAMLRCCAAARRRFNSRELNFHVMIPSLKELSL